MKFRLKSGFKPRFYVNILSIGRKSRTLEDQAPVVQKMDSAFHQINHCPVDTLSTFGTTGDRAQKNCQSMENVWPR